MKYSIEKNYLYIAILIVVFIGFAIFLRGGTQSSVGFSTLSLTTGTNYISSDPFFAGSPAYTIAVVADGSSGFLRGTFTPSQMREFTGSVGPSNNFDIKIDVNNQSCTYTLSSINPVPVYSYSWQPVTLYGPQNSPNGGTCSPQASITLQSGCGGSTTCNSCGGCVRYGCANVVGTKIGDMYKIDSVAHYNTLINVSLITSNNSYSIHLSPTSTNGQIQDVMKVSMIGGLQGTQSCPVPSSDTVLYRPVNTNILQAKSIAFYNEIYSYSISPPTASIGPDAPNSVVASFIASTLPPSSYCQTSSYSGPGSTYSCQPSSPVYLPLIKMNVKANILGVVMPSGTPKLISIDPISSNPGQTVSYNVVLKNIGQETDSFDMTLIGTPQITLQASRTSLSPGQQATIPIQIQGAGIIHDYILKVTSVNDPAKADTMTFKVKIDPYCDKTPEPGKVKISTEFGCQYVCAESFNKDLREKDCMTFGTFEPRGAYNSLTQTGTDSLGKPIYQNIQGLSSQFHCVGIKQYVGLEDYMDYVFSPRIDPVTYALSGTINTSRIFIPRNIPGTVWIGAPVCDYVGLFGYHYANGAVSVINDGIFTSFPSIPIGSLISITGVVQCPSGYTYDTITASCKYVNPGTPVCEAGSVYDPVLSVCKKILNTTIVCSNNAVYNSQTMQCEITGQLQYLCSVGNWDPVRGSCIYVPPTLNSCSQGTYDSNSGFCIVSPAPYYSCPAGSTYSSETKTCIITPSTSIVCIQGTYNVLTQRCEVVGVTQTICTVGTYNPSRNVCEVIAPINKVCMVGTYNPSNDKCDVFPGTNYVCSQGVLNPVTGKCELTAPIDKVCLQGVYNAQTDKCEVRPDTTSVCTQGVYNPLTRTCEISAPILKSCPVDYYYDNSTDKCIGFPGASCPKGFVIRDGKCSPELVLTCPSGYVLNGQVCSRTSFGSEIIYVFAIIFAVLVAMIIYNKKK